MENNESSIVLEGVWIDGMASLQQQLLKVLHVEPSAVRSDHFAEDLRRYLHQLPEPPREVIWKDHWLSCRKMRFAPVPMIIEYISLGPGYSNMMRDAVNAKADMQAAEHHRLSQEPLARLLAEIDVLFAGLGLKVTVED